VWGRGGRVSTSSSRFFFCSCACADVCGGGWEGGWVGARRVARACVSSSNFPCVLEAPTSLSLFLPLSPSSLPDPLPLPLPLPLPFLSIIFSLSLFLSNPQSTASSPDRSLPPSVPPSVYYSKSLSPPSPPSLSPFIHPCPPLPAFSTRQTTHLHKFDNSARRLHEGAHALLGMYYC
jgi:hypothetical protein